MKKTKTTIKPFYTTASKLLKMKVNNIEDVKNFYVGVNNLAAEISSNLVFMKELSLSKYNDNLKLLDGVNHILGYGQTVGRSNLFKEKSSTGALTVKKVDLSLFFRLNPLAKNEIEDIQKEATEYFKFTKIEREEIDALKKQIEELQKVLQQKEDNRLITIDKSSGDYYIHTALGARFLKLRRDTLYRMAFDAVYSLKPEGGKISFTDFEGASTPEINKRLHGKDNKGKCAYIKSLLTDPKNGFLLASDIGKGTFHGRPVIECTQKGIIFNNKK